MTRELTIYITRGDTYAFKFRRQDQDGNIITTAPDALYFTVKKDADTESFIFQKTFADMTLDEDGYIHCVIDPSDTESQEYGNYYFDIEVTANSVVSTICKGRIVITKEITWSQNHE